MIKKVPIIKVDGTKSVDEWEEWRKKHKEPGKLIWKKHDKVLVKGDILRTKVGNKEHPRYGEYYYSVCNGGGFGCNPGSMGNAIFVDHQSFDLNEVLKKRYAPTNRDTFSRWEAFWGIDYLKEEGVKRKNAKKN